MASIRVLTRADNSISYKIQWRDPETKKQTSFTTDSESEAKLVKRLLDANGQSFSLANKAMAEAQSQSPTVAFVVTEYLAEKTGVESGTKHTYEGMIAKHIVPTLGARKLDQLTRADIIKWFDKLPLAPKSKKNTHAFLSTAFNWAVEKDLMTENLARGISSPKSQVKYRNATFLSKDQYGILRTHIDDEYVLFVDVLANSGVRFGEGTALYKQDFLRRPSGHYVVDVDKSWKRTPSGFIMGAPKTEAGIRQITLPTFLTAPLDDLLSKTRSNTLVFQHPDGGRLTSGIFYNRYWQPAREAANAPELAKPLLAMPRIHDLRHTHASWLIDAGVPLPVISKRLGHSSISVTVDVYGHLASDADTKAADALG